MFVHVLISVNICDKVFCTFRVISIFDVGFYAHARRLRLWNGLGEMRKWNGSGLGHHGVARRISWECLCEMVDVLEIRLTSCAVKELRGYVVVICQKAKFCLW